MTTFTSVSKNPYQITWHINNFKIDRKNSPSLSEVFPTKKPLAFQLTFSEVSSKSEICISLNMIKSDGDKMLNYRVSLLDLKGEKRLVREGKGLFLKNPDEFAAFQRSTISVYRLLNHECIYTSSNSNSTISIHCEVNVAGWDRDIPPKPIPPPKTYTIERSDFDVKSSKVFDAMQELLNSGEMSDVTLVFGGKEFVAHKLILSARSSVFKRMFQHDFKENLENKVDIPDIGGEVGQEFLSFLYTGEAPNLEQFALDLLAVSDRYELESLKQECQISLSAKLAIDSVVQVLVLADMHRAPQLKEKCLDYITEHSEQVLATEGWKELNTRPELLIILYQKLSCKK